MEIEHTSIKKMLYKVNFPFSSRYGYKSENTLYMEYMDSVICNEWKLAK